MKRAIKTCLRVSGAVSSVLIARWFFKGDVPRELQLLAGVIFSLQALIYLCDVGLLALGENL